MSDGVENESLHCPNCGHDGAFDGMGSMTQDREIIRAGGESLVSRETWGRFHCPDCDSEFMVREGVERR